MRPHARQLAAVCSLGLATALAVSACQADPPASSPSPASSSALPVPQATLSPESIDLLHLADEPAPPADHLDPSAYGLTQDYLDPFGVFTEKMPPGSVSVITSEAIDTRLYRAPVTVYKPATTATQPPDQPEIDTFTVSSLQASVDPADIERRVVDWESQRLAAQPATGGASVSLVGQRTGSFRQIPAMVFKLRAGSNQLKVLTLVIGHTVYVISMTGTDDPPAVFDSFAVSFQLITNPTPQPSPSLPPPPTPTSAGSPSPGESPTPGTTPTPGNEGPGGDGATPPPV
jgi:hypothetical protein